MTKLPEPVALHRVSLDQYGMAPFDVKGYTKAQMLQFRRDVLGEAISLYSPDDTATDFINKIQSLFGDDE